MSTPIYHQADLYVTSFWGGTKLGRALQFTPEMGHYYSILSTKDVDDLIEVLKVWRTGETVAVEEDD